MARQAGGYWLVSLVSLVSSSAMTGLAADLAPSGGAARLLVVGVAYIGTLLVLWLGKLAVYHWVLFRPQRVTEVPPVGATAEHPAPG
jgi:hypothetical protein